MQLYIFCEGRDGCISLDVDPSMDIYTIKSFVETVDSNYLAANLRLFDNKGNNLDNDLSLVNCNICDDGTNIFSILRDDKTPPPKEGCYQLYVKTTETIYTLDIAGSDTVLDVKKKLVLKECNYMNQLDDMKVMFGEQELLDTFELFADYNITSESLLHLFITVEDDNADDDSEASTSSIKDSCGGDSPPTTHQYDKPSEMRVGGLLGGSENTPSSTKFDLRPSIKEVHHSITSYDRPSYLSLYTKKRLVPRGCSNTGNSCYINSEIQSISANPVIRNLFLGSAFETQLVPTTYECRDGSLYRLATYLLAEVLIMWYDIPETMECDTDPDTALTQALVKLRYQIGRNKNDYDNASQHDIAEFRNNFYEMIHNDLNMALTMNQGVKPFEQLGDKAPNESYSQYAARQRLGEIRRENSEITSQLVYQTASMKTCQHCRHQSTTFTCAQRIYADLQQDDCTLLQCLKNSWCNSGGRDHDGGYICQSCTKETDTDEQISLFKSSKTMQITLKRFIDGNRSGIDPKDYIQGLQRRIGKEIYCPMVLDIRGLMHAESLPMPDDEATYLLISTTEHKPGGSETNSRSGHYWCKALSSDGEWHLYDDSVVSDLPISNVITPDTYTLQYMRLDEVRRQGMEDAFLRAQEYENSKSTRITPQPTSNDEVMYSSDDDSMDVESDTVSKTEKMSATNDQLPLADKDGQRITMRNQSISTKNGGGSISNMDDSGDEGITLDAIVANNTTVTANKKTPIMGIINCPQCTIEVSETARACEVCNLRKPGEVARKQQAAALRKQSTSSGNVPTELFSPGSSTAKKSRPNFQSDEDGTKKVGVRIRLNNFRKRATNTADTVVSATKDIGRILICKPPKQSVRKSERKRGKKKKSKTKESSDTRVQTPLQAKNVAKEMARLKKIGKSGREEKHDIGHLPAEEEDNLVQVKLLHEKAERLRKELLKAEEDMSSLLCTKEEEPTSGFLYLRGIELQKMGNIEKAMESFDKALTLGPSNDLASTLHSRVDDCMKSLLFALLRGEGDKPPVPTSWEEWEYNQMFANLQRTLEAWPKVEKVANKYDRNAVPYLYFGNDLTMVEYVIIIDFPRDGQGAHLGYPDGVPNGYPPNATIRRLLDSLTDVLSRYLDIPPKLGLRYVMQKFAFFDVLAIDGPYNQADNTKKENKKNYNTYKEIKKEADTAMAEFMDQAFTLVPNAKLAVIKSKNASAFFDAHPNILPIHKITLPYKPDSPHPCIFSYGFVFGASENQGYAHLESLIALFQSYFDLKQGIVVSRGMLDIMFGRNINSIESHSAQLWDGEPKKSDSRLLLSKFTMKEVRTQIPIGSNAIESQIFSLKIGQHKKIKHTTLLDANENEVQLYVRKVKARIYFESEAMPLYNPNTAGKEEKANSGGRAMVPVALYLESALNKDAKDEYIINESAFAAQVGSNILACRILCIGGGKLNGIKAGIPELRTAIEERRGPKVTKGNDFVAIVGKASKNYQKGPMFESLPTNGKKRFIPTKYFTNNKMSVDAIEQIFNHHAEKCNKSCTDPNCRHWKAASTEN